MEGKQKALACVPSDVAFNVCPTRARSISFSNKHDRGQEKKKEIAAALARSLARSIDRSILRFGWCAIASRLSLTASTSASTSRSLHTDRGICYLVFATTRSEALARVRFAHAPPCLPILRTESARSLSPSLFPYGGREGIRSISSLSLSLSSSRRLEFKFSELERKCFSSFDFSDSTSFLLSLHLSLLSSFSNKGTNAFPSLVSP